MFTTSSPARMKYHRRIHLSHIRYLENALGVLLWDVLDIRSDKGGNLKQVHGKFMIVDDGFPVTRSQQV